MNKSEEFWDRTSENYDKTEARFEYIHNKTRENTEKYLNASDVVMDYGCGTGTKSCELASYVKEIHAIDISSKMIELAKEKAVMNKIENVNFEQGTIFDGKYKNESFDVILAFNMLHTVPNPQDVVQRIHELLKPEGLFISVTPCFKNKKSPLMSLMTPLISILSRLGVIPIPIRSLRSSDLDDLVGSRNFQAVETEQIYKGTSSYFIAAKKKLA